MDTRVRLLACQVEAASVDTTYVQVERIHTKGFHSLLVVPATVSVPVTLYTTIG